MSQKKKLILKTVENSDVELFPKQIASETGLNRCTVRQYLRILLTEGKLIQPYKGTYASKITYGMMLAPVRVHNVILVVDASWLNFSGDTSELVGSVKVRVQYGYQRRKITIRLTCDRGMVLDTFLFALHRAYDIIELRTGRSVVNVVVKTFELNRDVAGVRLDTVKCFTRLGFEGFLERVYQKGDFVRSEVKVSREMEVSQLESLLRGGVLHSQDVQFQYMLVQEVKKLTQVIKLQQEQLRIIYKLIWEKLKK